ncbi:Ig-like domain-containing protein [Vibrio caribbeanicus]|uniref:Ig-like domain-containing protein n=1 Tax=Vibrio caribbeanicus TaxID=701175 RepID=UPI0022848568|nr:Ig-like domain-containing protein [Vibrio caribbeanicus]MCY9844161.1 Ig-like domain-containing protein [Vibrio caribbeanicus]
MKTKHVFNLTLLCSALVLSGCGGGNSSSGTENQKLEPYLEASMARATTQTMILQGRDAKVPLSNNLLMDAKTGSLKIPTGGNDDISNPKAALNYAEGFSTTMPIYIEFSGNLDNSSAAGAVEVVSLMGVPFNDISVNVLGNQLIIKPTKPFQNDTQYLLVVTDDLLDAQGDRVGISRSYAHLKSSKTNYKGSVLESAKSLIQDQEKLAGQLGIDTTKIVYSASFKTASVGKVLTNTAKKLAGDRKEWASEWSGSRNPNDVNLGDAYKFTLKANPDFTGWFKDVFYETSLNFYLDGCVSAVPSISDRDGAKQYLNETIKVALGKVKLPYFLEAREESLKWVPFEPALAKGKAVTDYPKIKSLQDVPFVLFTPQDPSKTEGIVIYQHGITTFKETVVSIVPKLLQKGLAVIAIDHPLHGERGIGPFVANKDNPDVYLNLGALPVARDNMRQSVLDIIGLRIALRDLALEDNELKTLLDNAKDNVKFLGHSMGGIVGIPAVSIAQNLGLNLDFKSAVYSSAGGHIAELLFASEEFGPDIRHKLLMESNSYYQGFAKNECDNKVKVKVNGEEKPCFTLFQEKHKATAAAIEKELVPFKVAAQTLVDVVDPHSFLMSSWYTDKAKDVETLFIQVKGDEVVPNNGDSASALALTKDFIGTEALASLMTSETVTEREPDYTGNQVFVRFDNKGTHATLLKPKDDGSDATQFTEMQNLVAYFLSDSPTKSKPINDTTVLE